MQIGKSIKYKLNSVFFKLLNFDRTISIWETVSESINLLFKPIFDKKPVWS